jgi:hypothetical protein
MISSAIFQCLPERLPTGMSSSKTSALNWRTSGRSGPQSTRLRPSGVISQCASSLPTIFFSEVTPGVQIRDQSSRSPYRSSSNSLRLPCCMSPANSQVALALMTSVSAGSS